MREIKFRAWDKVCREMFYNSELANGDMMVICLDGEIQLSDDDTYKPDDFILMQYTGLKDKNGKEIYEGDILRVQTGWYKSAKNEVDKFDKGVKGETLWTVEHKIFNCEMGFMIYGLDRRFHKLMTQSMMWNTKAEVIGNIYENPELLGGD